MGNVRERKRIVSEIKGFTEMGIFLSHSKKRRKQWEGRRSGGGPEKPERLVEIRDRVKKGNFYPPGDETQGECLGRRAPMEVEVLRLNWDLSMGDYLKDDSIIPQQLWHIS